MILKKAVAVSEEKIRPSRFAQALYEGRPTPLPEGRGAKIEQDMPRVPWALQLPSGAVLLPALGTGRRWVGGPRAKAAIKHNQRLHSSLDHIRTGPHQLYLPPPEKPLLHQQVRTIGWAIVFWLINIMGGDHHEHEPCKMSRDIIFDGKHYTRQHFQPIRRWLSWTDERGYHPGPRLGQLEADAAEEGLCAVPSLQLGGKRGGRRQGSSHMSKPKPRTRARTYVRDRLNSSDDVIGQEEIDIDDSTGSDAAESQQDPDDKQEQRRQRMEELAYRWTPEASSITDMQQGPSPYIARGASRAQSQRPPWREHEEAAERGPTPETTQPSSSTARAPTVVPSIASPAWTMVGSRWRFTIRTKGLPWPFLHLHVAPNQIPLSPAKVDQIAYEQYPELSEYCDRISLIRFQTETYGTPVPHHLDCFSPWEFTGTKNQVMLTPSMAMGTAEEIAMATRTVRAHARLSLLMDAKVTKTVLGANYEPPSASTRPTIQHSSMTS